MSTSTNTGASRSASRSTPCVGICSTTYGDLVCRGCKRFAHEIVQWNGFDSDQRAAVWSRLAQLREGAVGQWLRVFDEPMLRVRAELSGIPEGKVLGPDGETLGALHLAYDVLRITHMPLTQLHELGIELLNNSHLNLWTRDLVRQIDREFYARSLAHYERNFRIAAQ